MSIACRKTENQDLIFLGSYSNEKHILGHIRRNLTDVKHAEITVSLRNCLKYESVLNLLTILLSIPRLLRIAKIVTRKYDFMPACRIFSTITYYMRFKQLLNGTGIKGVFIANQYSPETVAIAAAAHKSKMKVLFTNHANATGETGYVAPIYADLVAVTSQALADLYSRHTRKNLHIVPIPISTQQNELRLPYGNNLSVGIYLTALTNVVRLQNIIKGLGSMQSIVSVFIRLHPAQIVNLDLSEIVRQFEVTISPQSQLLQEDISRTDFAICGNSTVAIELLRGGRPVVYDEKLDELPHDYNGYLKNGLIPICSSEINGEIINLIESHYGNKSWVQCMQYFDTSYAVDSGEINRKFHNAVIELIANKM